MVFFRFPTSYDHIVKDLGVPCTRVRLPGPVRLPDLYIFLLASYYSRSSRCELVC
jgi:hypothetical protein